MTDPTAVAHSDPEILGGTPVFVGTRVPFQNLIDYLVGTFVPPPRSASPTSPCAHK
jgi:hypothetical protein